MAEQLVGAHGGTPPNLLVRFRRGDDWISGRLCSAGVNGIFVATDTPARLGKVIDLELSLDDDSAWRTAGLLKPELCLRGVVAMSRAAGGRGPAGFSAQLRYTNHRQRRELVTMLQAARGRAKLKPPPRRTEARYPISWPILVKVANQRCRMSALDISRGGMFVGGAVPLPSHGKRLHITFSLDHDGPPIHAITQVTRVVSRDLARRRKLRRGIGLQLTELPHRYQRDYHDFVDRVAHRSRKNVVVTAAGIRLVHLMTELAAVGYAVSSATDPTALFKLCNDHRNAPDLVIFDSSFRDAHPTAVSRARGMLTAQLVATADYDEPFAEPIRAMADAILAPVDPSWVDQSWA